MKKIISLLIVLLFVAAPFVSAFYTQDDAITIGDGAATDAGILIDGNAYDYYIKLDDSADDLIIGTGSTVGTNPAITVNETKQVTISSTLIIASVAHTARPASGAPSGAIIVVPSAGANNCGTAGGSNFNVCVSDGTNWRSLGSLA